MKLTKCPKCEKPCWLVSDVLLEEEPPVEFLKLGGGMLSDALLRTYEPHRWRCQQQFEKIPHLHPRKPSPILIRESEAFPWEPEGMPRARRVRFDGTPL